MTKTFLLEIIAPGQIVFKEDVQSLVCRADEGELGILPGHTDLLAHLKPGEIHLTDKTGTRKEITLAGGFLEVHPAQVTILTE